MKTIHSNPVRLIVLSLVLAAGSFIVGEQCRVARLVGQIQERERSDAALALKQQRQAIAMKSQYAHAGDRGPR